MPPTKRGLDHINAIVESFSKTLKVSRGDATLKANVKSKTTQKCDIDTPMSDPSLPQYIGLVNDVYNLLAVSDIEIDFTTCLNSDTLEHALGQVITKLKFPQNTLNNMRWEMEAKASNTKKSLTWESYMLLLEEYVMGRPFWNAEDKLLSENLPECEQAKALVTLSYEYDKLWTILRIYYHVVCFNSDTNLNQCISKLIRYNTKDAVVVTPPPGYNVNSTIGLGTLVKWFHNVPLMIKAKYGT